MLDIINKSAYICGIKPNLVYLETVTAHTQAGQCRSYNVQIPREALIVEPRV